MATKTSLTNLTNLIIPQEYLRDGQIAWDRVQSTLGLLTNLEVMNAIFYLYRTDPKVNWHVNVALVSALADKVNGRKRLPLVPPEHSEHAWFLADSYCEKCPGTELYDLGEGFFIPRCMNMRRVERYADCLKYRENLASADDKVDGNVEKVKEDLQSFLNQDAAGIKES